MASLSTRDKAWVRNKNLVWWTLEGSLTLPPWKNSPGSPVMNAVFQSMWASERSMCEILEWRKRMQMAHRYPPLLWGNLTGCIEFAEGSCNTYSCTCWMGVRRRTILFSRRTEGLYYPGRLRWMLGRIVGIVCIILELLPWMGTSFRAGLWDTGLWVTKD